MIYSKNNFLFIFYVKMVILVSHYRKLGFSLQIIKFKHFNFLSVENM
ncbi:hypothetical protein M153_2910002245 [Pseudoloma neurophilia]|uniref:Uncharacterized protein n=1 Tax=Pseudoloma neurophilia TaxID=146866 RepID=A0A0R0LYD3_9MICR|nr:hypothetical protein M153_2910002245 [Pseudoloma neurophilia]